MHYSRPQDRDWPASALALALLILLVGAGCAGGSTPLAEPTPTATLTATSTPTPTPTPTRTPEPLVPTVPASSPEPAATSSRTPTRVATVNPSPTPSPAAAMPLSAADRERFGVGVALGRVGDFAVEKLRAGWYLNWRVEADPAWPEGVAFWPMIRVSEAGYRPNADAIRQAVRANPGATWLIGNEPDVPWQDGVTPERYAELYHELHHLIKDSDPSARVAIGGVSQPTPLRLSYLDRVLTAYRARTDEEMPVDVWNVHVFVLREERDSWGVGIPPGMDVDQGTLYEIDEHDDLSIVRGHITTFRRWMADHGQRDKPLVISEYGILMPADYGFDVERVQAFMEGSFDLFLTATDEELGYPADDDRLVQRWCWYSLADSVYPTSNLFDHETRAMTPLGAAFARYTRP